VPFDNLPQATGAAQPFFVNWNNKPVEWWDQGDNVPWLGDQRVDSLYTYVPGGAASFSYQQLKGVPDAIDDFGTYQQATRFGATLADEVFLRLGALASGTCFLRLRAGERTATQPVVLVR
jgi:hypothetical protein